MRRVLLIDSGRYRNESSTAPSGPSMRAAADVLAPATLEGKR
jgi:hypothetical protein